MIGACHLSSSQVGYAGWAPAQLQGEVERNSWFLASADSGTLLQELLRQGTELPPPSCAPPLFSCSGIVLHACGTARAGGSAGRGREGSSSCFASRLAGCMRAWDYVCVHSFVFVAGCETAAQRWRVAGQRIGDVGEADDFHRCRPMRPTACLAPRVVAPRDASSPIVLAQLIQRDDALAGRSEEVDRTRGSLSDRVRCTCHAALATLHLPPEAEAGQHQLPLLHRRSAPLLRPPR